MHVTQNFSGKMSQHKHTHTDMLQLCCGICGRKRKPPQLRKITDNILAKMKSIEGYSEYDLADDRYPKVLCSEHYCAVIERNSDKPISKYKYRLPSEILNFQDIQLPHASTRSTTSGFPTHHTCFLCEQNVVGRPPKLPKTMATDAAVASTSSPVCSKCFQTTGRGIPHPCIKKAKNVVDTVSSAIEGMSDKMKDQVVYKLVKSKVESSVTSTVSLSTAGHAATLQLNPSVRKKEHTLRKKTLDTIYTKANLTMNQARIVVGGIQADMGRNSVPPRYREKLSQQTRTLEEYFISERHRFVIETKSGVITDERLMWTVYAPILPLVRRVMMERGLEDPNSEDYMIKVMADTGQGKTKICFCICPTSDSSGLEKKKRSTYAEGGVLNKASSWLGIKKCIMCFCAPEIKELNSNLKTVFDLIQIEDLMQSYGNVILIGDLKLLNEVYGLMEASSKHPCLYCDAESQTLQAGAPRTIGSIRKDYAAWKSSGSQKITCKDFNNVKNLPLFENIRNDTHVMKLTPPPALHILLGIFNHLWKAIEGISGEHSRVLQDFAMQHNCMRESYWSKTFEGNECARLMTKISSSKDVDPLLTLPGIETHIRAIQAFNNVRVHVFGNVLHANWKNMINDFALAYECIPGISKPLKVHILIAHCKQFIDLYGKGKGLGFYSEQTGEAIHKDFDKTFVKYKFKNIHDEEYGKHLLKAVVEFSSMHI